MRRKGERLAWLRLNAYGVLVAFLAVLSLTDLLHPGQAEFARIVGDIPPGQPLWTTGFIISGLLLLAGFVRGDRIAETLGLGLMTGGLVAQVITAYAYLGFTEFTTTRIALLIAVAMCLGARASVLWSKRGLIIHIPARGETETGDER